MGQLLIRNLDPELVEDYRQAAAANHRSLEAELRLALEAARPVSLRRRDALAARLAAIRSLGGDVPAGSTIDLLREDRDR
ncbi:hypothetical protein FJQ54_13415 [Sandaracinobacter neustonicus]|uniref:Antitoxin FitA-like ribbon-helix-helix domain-containing protein n=1 Tax=Sandaracinobacter neustonicus TaxID=1715348 RepID=A0A501XFT8_9SPHN|nr:hypothetical protein [Sandaracinobacter neustonicus]TPE59481.1 hypothetical protein FJQ54_13415 [Sandaracinobacter neustonicus]